MEARIRVNGSMMRNMDTGSNNGLMEPSTLGSLGIMLLTAKAGSNTKTAMFMRAT